MRQNRRHIALISTLLLALLWTSCLREEISDYNPLPDRLEADTYVSTRFALGLSTGETVKINTVRVIIFTAAGEFITHRVRQLDRLFSYDDDIAEFLSIPTKSGQSEVFVIVNENVSHFGGTSLTAALDATKTVSGLQTLLSNPIEFNTLREANGQEPFIMYVRETFNVVGGYRFDDPFVLDFTTELVRPMARVTITGITSEMMSGQIDDRCDEMKKEISRFFVLDMGLENVPNRFSWGNPSWMPNANTDFHNRISFNRQDATFSQDNISYFSRDWNGKVSIMVAGNARVRQEVRLIDGRVWFIGGPAGQNASISIHRDCLDKMIAGTHPSGANLNNNNNLIFNNPPEDAIPRLPDNALNNGNIPRLFQSLIELVSTNLNPDDFELPDFVFVTADEHLDFEVEGGNWTVVAENLSFYIPENLNSSKATSLYITATRASLPTIVKGFNIFEGKPVTWEPWQSSQAVGATQISTVAQIQVFQGAELDRIPITINGNIVRTPIVRYYWDIGAIVWRYGTITESVTFTNQNDQDIDFKVTLEDRNAAETFVIPIADDLITLRNHDYRFSVHVEKCPWKSRTRSSGVMPLVLQRVK